MQYYEYTIQQRHGEWFVFDETGCIVGIFDTDTDAINWICEQ